MTLKVGKNLALLDELERLRELLQKPWDEAMDSDEARLQRRAAALAREREAAPQTGATLSLLLFRAADVLHGLDLAGIEKVWSWRSYVMLPGSPGHLAGVADINGEIISIMDMRRLLHGAGHAEDRTGRLMLLGKPGQRMGLLVDGLEGIRTVALEEIQPPPVATPPALGRYLLGVTLDGVCVLDANKLINAPDLTINQDFISE